MTTAERDRVLPHNLEAEKCVLGAILINNHAFNQAAEVFDAQDFFRDAHRRIFEKMVGLTDRNEPVDLVTLKDELGRSGELDEVGGPAYIAALTDGVPRSANIEYYAKIVKEKADLRRLIQSAKDTITLAYDSDLSGSAAAMSKAVSGLDIQRAGREGRTVYGIAYALQRAREYLADDGSQRLRLGLDRIDRATRGVALGELLVILARTGSLKTNVSLCVVREWVTTFPGLAFLVANLEMPCGQVTTRLLRMETGLSERALGLAMAENTIDVDAFLAKYARVQFVDQGVVGLAQIQRYAEQLERGDAPLGGIIVDHAGLVQATGKSAYEKATETAIGLKQLARHLEVAVVGIVQANRVGGQGKDDEPVALESARDSGAFEENADFCLSLSKLISPTDGRAPYINARLTKNRRGPCVPSCMSFDPVNLRMQEIEGANGR